MGAVDPTRYGNQTADQVRKNTETMDNNAWAANEQKWHAVQNKNANTIAGKAEELV